MTTNCPDNSNNGSGPRIYFDSLVLNKEYIIKQIELYTPYNGSQETYNTYFYVILVEKTDSKAKFELFCSKDEGGSWSENEVLEPNGSDAFIEYIREVIDNEDMTGDGITAEIYDAEAVQELDNLPQQPSLNSSIYDTSSNYNSNNSGNRLDGGRRRRKTKKARRSKKRTIRRQRRR